MASGVGVVLTRDGFDRRIRSKDQVRRLTGLDVLGVAAAHLGAASFSEASSARPTVPQFVRRLRTLVLTAAAGARYPAVGIVSHGCGEGRTLLAGNLASAIASAGHPVTLIDADLRNPALTARLAPAAEWGLCDLVLARGADATDCRSRSMRCSPSCPPSAQAAVTIPTCSPARSKPNRR